MQWRYEVIDRFLRECQIIVKRAKPEAIFYYNFLADTFNTWVRGQSIKSGKIADYLGHDAYVIAQGLLALSLEARVLAAASSTHKFEVHLERTIGHSSDYEIKPLNHLKAEAFTVIANGGAPLLFDLLHPDGTVRSEVWNAFAIVFEEIEEREEWLVGAQRVRFAAVFFSENSRDFSQVQTEERYSEHIGDLCGTCKALLESHIPFSIITDLKYKTLLDYKLLILPNTVSLSEEEITNIRDFVKEGGRLIATFETSLKDENNVTRNDFALQDVFKVHYKGLFEYSENYIKPAKEHPITQNISDSPIFHEGPQIKIESTKDVSILGEIVYPYLELEPSAEQYPGICNAPSEKADLSAITYAKFGEGGTVYFAGKIGEMFLKYPRYKMLLKNTVQWLAKDTLPIKVEAPSCVEITLFEQMSEKRLIVHLVNFQTEVGRNIVLAGKENFHLIEEVLPVYNIQMQIKIPEDKKVKEVYLAPQKESIDYECKEGYLKLNVPKVEMHRIVVIQW